MTFHLRKIVLFYNILQFALIFWEIVSVAIIYFLWIFLHRDACPGRSGGAENAVHFDRQSGGGSHSRACEAPPAREGSHRSEDWETSHERQGRDTVLQPRRRSSPLTVAVVHGQAVVEPPLHGGSPVPTGSGESRDPRLPDARAGSVGSTAQLLVHRMSGRRSEVSILVTFLLAQKVWLWGTWLVELTAWCRTADSLFISHLSVSDVHILDAGATAAVSIAPIPLEMEGKPLLTQVVRQPGGDPTKVNPNVATFAWNASRMSDRTDLTPTNVTDFAADIVLTLTAGFHVRDDVTEIAVSHVIRNSKANAKYFTDAIVWCGLLRTLSTLTF